MTRAFAIGLALLVACGGDDEGTSSKAPPPPSKAAAKPKSKGGKGPATLKTITVEDRVPEIERATIRHLFRESDFKPDSLGTENRDPFRSYVVAQVGGTLDSGLGTPDRGPVTPSCSQKQMVGTNYGLRDLRLVGIVSKRAEKFALFQDTKDYGHIIHRGDCLGREKAKVKDIGAGFVTLELVPEQGGAQEPRAPEERSIPLYPNELKLGETDRDRDRGDNGPAPVTPPEMPAGEGGPTGTQPVMPTPPPQ